MRFANAEKPMVPKPRDARIIPPPQQSAAPIAGTIESTDKNFSFIYIPPNIYNLNIIYLYPIWLILKIKYKISLKAK